MLKVMALVGLFVVCGCGGADNDLFSCTPGRQESCPCAGGGQGIQVCNADGAFGACECGGEGGAGGSAGSSEASTAGVGGNGGATNGGGGTGGAPAGCDLHPAADGFMCIPGCPEGDYLDASKTIMCGAACWGNVNGIPPMINLGVPSQDIAYVFPPDPFGAIGCSNCEFTTGARWSFTLGMAGEGCARFTTSGPGGFSEHQGRPNSDSKCGTASPPSCFLFSGTGQKIWDYWVTYAAPTADDPMWIRVETLQGNDCSALACN